jgi:hypothetical protein
LSFGAPDAFGGDRWHRGLGKRASRAQEVMVESLEDAKVGGEA